MSVSNTSPGPARSQGPRGRRPASAGDRLLGSEAVPPPTVPAAFRRVVVADALPRVNRRRAPGLPLAVSAPRPSLRDPAADAAAGGAAVEARASVSVALDVVDDDAGVRVWSQTCASLENEASGQTLVVSYSFTAAPEGDPYPVVVVVAGRLVGEAQAPGATTFSVSGRVHRVIPGCGRVTLTLRIPDLAPGEWEVTATPTADSGPADGAHRTVSGRGVTSFSLLAPLVGPGLRIGGWPAMVTAGALLGLALQTVLAHRVGLAVTPLLWVTLTACVLGVLGAKLYYAATHRDEKHGFVGLGMSVQGFVLVAFGVIVAATSLLRMPVGLVLDVSAPALLLGQAVGRIGCWFGGCCVGRPTAGRWGVWAADRVVGVRRIPVRLMESVTAMTLAISATTTVLLGPPRPVGWLFLAAVSAYVMARQLLLPLRELPRATRHGRSLVLVASAVTLVTSVMVLIAA